MVASLPKLDDSRLPRPLRVRYDFSFPGVAGPFPGWRRYGIDGYGEDAATGGNYGVGGKMASGQRGRVWPIFTGERGHYELALAGLKGKRPDAAMSRHPRPSMSRPWSCSPMTAC
jgi:glucoamylase